MQRALAALVLMASSTFAASLSFTGNLSPADPNDVKLIEFTLLNAASVTFQSYGYGGSANAPGGTNAAGSIILPGGFDPYFSLFQGAGDSATFLVSNDDGACPPGVAVPACLDSTITANLAAGTYTLAVSVFGNMSFAENLGTGTLGDGFIGLGNYYDAVSDTVRSPSYAVDVSSAGGHFGPPATVPEPGNAVLLGSAGLLLGLSRLRRRK
jgi:hypothetical protein